MTKDPASWTRDWPRYLFSCRTIIFGGSKQGSSVKALLSMQGTQLNSSRAGLEIQASCKEIVGTFMEAPRANDLPDPQISDPWLEHSLPNATLAICAPFSGREQSIGSRPDDDASIVLQQRVICLFSKQ